MKALLLQWLAWSNATEARFILIWGVLAWGGGMTAWNLTDILQHPPIWNELILIGVLLLGGFVFGWLMWRFKKWWRPSNRPTSN